MTIRRTCAAIAAATLAGCGSDGGLNKAGTDAKSKARVLTMETTDLVLYDDPGLAAFPKLVEKRSGGRMKVRLKLVPGVELDKSNSTRLEHLRDSDADLGWDAESLSTLSPAWNIPFLPFLVDSFELQRSLFAGDYDEKLLASLDGTPLEGVALFPGHLTRVWSLEEPIRTREDWRRVRLFNFYPPSPIRDRAMRAVGVHAEDDYQKVRNGRLNAMDWISRGLQINAIGNHGVVGTLNVATGSRAVAIIGNRRRLARLNADERRWLREAAADATEVSLGQTGMVDEPELFALNCRTTRMRGVLAPQAEVDALREVVRPIYASVKDPTFQELYELIEATRSRTPPEDAEVPPPCRGRVPSLPLVEKSKSPRALDGQYRFKLDLEDFRRAGMEDDVINRDYAGLWTVRFDNGRGTLVRRASDNALSDEPLRVRLEYKVDGDRVTFDSPFEAVSFGPTPPVTLRWRLAGGALSFTPVHPLDWFDTTLFSVDWARVR